MMKKSHFHLKMRFENFALFCINYDCKLDDCLSFIAKRCKKTAYNNSYPIFGKIHHLTTSYFDERWKKIFDAFIRGIHKNLVSFHTDSVIDCFRDTQMIERQWIRGEIDKKERDESISEMEMEKGKYELLAEIAKRLVYVIYLCENNGSKLTKVTYVDGKEYSRKTYQTKEGTYNLETFRVKNNYTHLCNPNYISPKE